MRRRPSWSLDRVSLLLAEWLMSLSLQSRSSRTDVKPVHPQKRSDLLFRTMGDSARVRRLIRPLFRLQGQTNARDVDVLAAFEVVRAGGNPIRQCRGEHLSFGEIVLVQDQLADGSARCRIHIVADHVAHAAISDRNPTVAPPRGQNGTDGADRGIDAHAV